MTSQTGYPSIERLHEKGAKFSEKHPIIPSINIYTLLKMICKKYSKETAIECLDVSLTFDELLKMADSFAHTLVALGIKKGDIVVITTPNYYQAIIVFMAANKLGVIVTFINSKSALEEVEEYLNKYESPLLINYDTCIAINQIIKNSTKLKYIITVEKDEVNQIPKNISHEKISTFMTFSQAYFIGQSHKRKTRNVLKGRIPSVILYTSGTTGKPKAVVLSNTNIIATAVYLRNSSKVTNKIGEKSLVCVPFCYPYGFVTSVLMSLLCGRTAILGPDISKDNISYYISKNPNIIFGSPALLALILRNMPASQDMSSVESFISGGDFLNAKFAEEAITFFKAHNSNVKIFNGSGNAETCGGNTNSYGHNLPMLSVGYPYIGVRAIVVDENLRELPYEKEGMLCLSGKNVFMGYYNDTEMTKEVLFSYKGRTYIKTGTNGRLLLDGSFELTGRSSRFYIISSLNKVYCDHVQEVLNAIDCIEASAVVKKEDKDKLYVGHAFIILKQGYENSEYTKEEILKSCMKEVVLPNGNKAILKPYEIPAEITFLDEFPHTTADKIDYIELENMAK